MKRLILIFAILLFIAVGEYTALFRTKQYTDSLSAALTSLSSEEAPLRALETLEKEWFSRRKLMSLFLHERSMDEFERLLYRAKLHAAADDSDTALLLLEAAAAAENIWQSERADLQNIL